MRRADRLFQIVQMLRARRCTTAAQLAERMEVSQRTIYRDILDLQSSGVPICGAAGSGYTLSERVDLPPLLFTREELCALQFGLRVAAQCGDDALGNAARSAQEKVIGALPRDRRARSAAVPLFASGVAQPWLGAVRNAIEQGCKLSLHYRDEGERHSIRVVWPLGLFYWGRVWTVAAWCEKRAAFREFRLDRIAQLNATAEPFPSAPGRTLADYWAMLERQHDATIPAEWRENFRV